MLLEGGGLIDVAAANDPKLFAEPVVALVRLPERRRARRAQGAAARALRRRHRRRCVERLGRAAVGDAGLVDRAEHLVGHDRARAGRSTCRSSRPPRAPRRPATTRASSSSPAAATRIRIPYYFTVSRPADRPGAARHDQGRPARRHEQGHELRQRVPLPDRAVRAAAELHRQAVQRGRRRAASTRCASASTSRTRASRSPQSAPDALVEPWFLGSLNEDDVQGYPGTPVNVNGLTFEYQFDDQSAAVDFPHEGRYFVSVDSRADPYTDLLAAGRVPAALVAERRHAAALQDPDEGRLARPAADRGHRPATAAPASTRSRS